MQSHQHRTHGVVHYDTCLQDRERKKDHRRDSAISLRQAGQEGQE